MVRRILARRRWRWLALAAALAVILGAAAGGPTEEYTIELGPFNLPSGAGHDGVEQPRPLTLALPVEGWLRSIAFDVVDDRGEKIPGALHHLNLIAPEQRELFSQIRLRIGAAGSETKPYGLPWFLGLPLHRGDSLLVTAMLHNPTGKEHHGVKVRVRLGLTPSTSWLRPVGIRPVYLDVMPPAGRHAFDLPPGRSTRSWEGRPAVPARLLAAGSHLHEYGTRLKLEDVSAGKVLWEARPKLDDKGEVVGMPIHYFLPLGVRLTPDHVYRITAEYDNPTGEVLEGGGMGAIGGIVLPDDGNAWPAVARGDSVYLHDVRTHGNTTAMMNGSDHHHSAEHRH
jgi:hypothetical protein